MLIVDLFPPTVRDPKGLHKLIWDEIEDQPFELPTGQDRVLVSYQAGREKVAYIEPLAIGDTNARHAAVPDDQSACQSSAGINLQSDMGRPAFSTSLSRVDRTPADRLIPVPSETSSDDQPDAIC